LILPFVFQSIEGARTNRADLIFDYSLDSSSCHRVEPCRPLEAARVAAEKYSTQIEALHDEIRPGFIELTVQNVESTDSGFAVEIDGEVVKRTVKTKTSAVRNIPAGIHELTVSASINGAEAYATELVAVETNQIAKVLLMLVDIESNKPKPTPA